MYSFYLCDDNETVNRLNILLKPEEKNHYLALLQNYLEEIVFVSESETKKMVAKEEVEKEKSETISTEEQIIYLTKTSVEDTTVIEDYLPLVATIRTKKYTFLRPITICFLVILLSEEIAKIDNPYLSQMAKLLDSTHYIDFSLLWKNFYDENGVIIPEKSYDYNSVIGLLKAFTISTIETYSRSSLLSFWQGDDAEREIADWIAKDSLLNRKVLDNLNLRLLPPHK